MSVTDAIGKSIELDGQMDSSVDLSQEADGFYFIKYQSGNNIFCTRVLKN
jgi:hypothetical protein